MVFIGCYKPLARLESKTHFLTAKDGHKYGQPRIISTESLEDVVKNMNINLKDYKVQMIPCGKCIGCRLDYAKEWANRGYLECMTSENNWFITLTYDDEHLNTPEEMTTSDEITFTELQENDWKGTLWPADLKQFMKNLRQILSREHDHAGIKFMAAGEYGEQGERPHFHVILYNCPLPTETFYDSRIDWKKDVYWKCDIIDRAWGKGIAEVGEANWNTIGYTARYITKKLNGEESEYFYAAKGQIREFMRTSKRPAIAREYFDKNMLQIYDNDKVLIVNKSGCHWQTPPKYFDRLFKELDPNRWKEIQGRRINRKVKALQMKAETTSLTMWEQLQVEQLYKENCTKTLKRDAL